MRKQASVLRDLPKLVIGNCFMLPSEGLTLSGLLGQVGEWREIGNGEIRWIDGRYQSV